MSDLYHRDRNPTRLRHASGGKVADALVWGEAGLEVSRFGESPFYLRCAALRWSALSLANAFLFVT